MYQVYPTSMIHLSLCAKAGIRSLLLDFDLTVLRIHSFSKMMKNNKRPSDFTEGNDMSEDCKFGTVSFSS